MLNDDRSTSSQIKNIVKKEGDLMKLTSYCLTSDFVKIIHNNYIASILVSFNMPESLLID